MRELADFHLPALESAVAELSRHRGRWEVYARSGTTIERRWRRGGEWESREANEAGVACRVAVAGTVGFAAAAGSAAAAGREAARAALAGRMPGLDPLPPVSVLGRAEVGAPPPATEAAALESFARKLLDALDAPRGAGNVAEVRVMAGSSRAAILTAEGYSAPAGAAAALIEVLADGSGSSCVFAHASRSLVGLDPAAVADRARAVLSISGGRGGLPRQLGDAILLPAVAARLLDALATLLVATAGHDARLPDRAAPAWDLVDARPGPEGLLPLPWDGEGVTSRVIPLVSGGRVSRSLATWQESRRSGAAPGGAVRPSYRAAPHAGAANLVQRPGPSRTASALLAELGEGVCLALPVGEVALDPRDGRFSLVCAGVVMRGGRQHGGPITVELRGSMRRLVRGLHAVGSDSESYSLGSAVTTPSLLVRGLEIA